MAARKARKSTSKGTSARSRTARSSSSSSKKPKRTASAAKKASAKKASAAKKAKKAKAVKKPARRKPVRAAAPRKKLKKPARPATRKAARPAPARKKAKKPRSAAARRPAARAAAKTVRRRTAAKKTIKKSRARAEASRPTKVRRTKATARKAASKRIRAVTKARKKAVKRTAKTTLVTRAKSKARTKAAATERARKLRLAAAKAKKGKAKGAKVRKSTVAARARRSATAARRLAADKRRARMQQKAAKALARKQKKEAAAAKAAARKAAAKEAKARAVEAARAQRAKQAALRAKAVAEGKKLKAKLAQERKAEREARALERAAAKKAAKAPPPSSGRTAASGEERDAKAGRGKPGSVAPSAPPGKPMRGDAEPGLRVGTSRSKMQHATLKSKTGQPSEAPPRAGKKGEAAQASGKGSTPPGGASSRVRVPLMRPVLPTLPIEPPRPTLEERAAQVTQRLDAQSEDVRKEYEERLFMSWIHHDSALEGVVYAFHELQIATDPAITVVPDSSMQPVCDEIRRHKLAIDFVRDAATKKRQPVTTDVIKRIYLILHPEEGDLKTVKYRKDIPQHRLYFHEYAPPDKIAYLVRQVVEWVNDPETKRTRTTLRIAARAHYDLLRAFPFPNDSGKVARLFMNFLLLRAGYPPAIVHSTERQRYYEALKGSPLAIVHMVQEALENSIASIEKFLDERTTRVRSFVS